MRRRTDIWFLIALFAILFVGGYFAAAPQSRTEDKSSTTFNADPNGVKALYTLLGERLGYRVERLERPYTELPSAARVLIVVQPQNRLTDTPLPYMFDHSISDNELEALTRWVRAGGIVMFYSDDLEGVPGAFGYDHSIGRGAVHTVSSRAPITNRGMRDSGNGVEIVRTISAAAGRSGLILFDEYHHGLRQGGSIWSYVSRQAWIAFGMLLVAAGVMCHTRGRRFGAVRSLPKEETLRPGFEFVKSVGRLYSRGRASDLAAEILCRSFKRKLCAKHALPADAPVETVISRLAPASRDRVSAVLSGCTSYAAGQKPTDRELLEIANQIHQLEEELRLGRIDT